MRIPLAEERIDVQRVESTVATHFVEVRTEEHVKAIETALRHDSFDIERVAVGRVVDAAPPIRQEGDVTIVPILEEEVVVTRRLILKEEIRLRRVTRMHHQREEIALRREHAEIRRVPTDDIRSGEQHDQQQE